MMTAPSQQPAASRRAAAVAAANALAGQYREFRTKFPHHPSVADARYEEVSILNYGAMNGDSSNEARRLALIGEVRRDTTLSSIQRFRAVAWSQQVTISRQKTQSFADKLKLHEAVSRALIEEFPSVEDGYESLLAIAQDSEAARGKPILQELLISAAPASIKSAVAKANSRFDLIGKTFVSLSVDAGISLPESFLDARKPIVIYAWSPASPSSIAAAKSLKKQVSGAPLYGICLDTNAANIEQLASSHGLDDPQILGPKAAMDKLIVTLIMEAESSCYIIDAAGIIRDVNSRLQLRQKLAKLSNPNQ